MALVITYQLTGIETLTKKQVNDALKAAMRSVGEYWHDAFAWKRFTSLGYTEYNFRPRSRKYNQYKIRHRGHDNPLVLSGEARDEALSESTKTRIRTTRDSVTVPLPRKLNRYNPAGPNLSQEVRAVSRDEIRQLEQALVAFIHAELDRQVPAHQRNRGFVGGRVESLQIRGSRAHRVIEPIARRRAA